MVQQHQHEVVIVGAGGAGLMAALYASRGADTAVLANSMTGTFEYEKGDKRPLPDFNVFFRYHATYPFYSDAIWTLTQMRRWGQIDVDHADDWYFDVAKRVYRPDIYTSGALEIGQHFYGRAERKLVMEGAITDYELQRAL